MGQYYKPVNLDKQEGLHTHDYVQGLKLMEHSYLRNEFVRTVERLLTSDGKWGKCRFAWIGDYSGEESYNAPEITPPASDEFYPYVINHTKKEYVKKLNKDTQDEDLRNELQIHPLPLLTALGNGEGGGDFRGEDPEGLVGRWAKDIISVSEIKPSKEYEEIIFDLKEQY